MHMMKKIMMKKTYFTFKYNTNKNLNKTLKLLDLFKTYHFLLSF